MEKSEEEEKNSGEENNIISSDNNVDNLSTVLSIENSKMTQFEKFQKEGWGKIEKEYGSINMMYVLDVLYNLGSSEKKEFLIGNNIKCCNDDVYEIIRDNLVKLNVLSPIKKKNNSSVKKKGGKKGKKGRNNNPKKLSKQEIRIKNIISKTATSLEQIIDSYKKEEKFRCIFGFRSKYAELRIITLILCANNFIDNKVSDEKCYELVIGIKKTLHNISNLYNLSKLAYSDLKETCEKLMDYCDFSFEYMFENFPKLCIFTKYDIIFPSISIKPYESQIKLMEAMRPYDKKCLYFYNAMIGSGKTTFSIALCRYVEELREKNINNDIQLLFSCSVEPVRREVCRMAYNKNIPFGVGVMVLNKTSNTKYLKVINNYNCSQDSKRIIIIADLDSTIELLKKSSNYILFLDEPTIGSDQPDHPITHAISKILLLAPEKTILSSATLPDKDEVVPIVDYFKKKHNTEDIFTICSKEALIGCQMTDFTGRYIIPFSGCNTCEELRSIIDKLTNKLFIDRLLPAPIVYKLRKLMVTNGVKDVIDIEEIFDDITFLCQTKIQSIAIDLLNQLINTDDDNIVKKICNSFEDKSHSLNIDQIFTSDAYKIAGPCLLTVNDPVQFCKSIYDSLLKDCPNATNIIRKYDDKIKKNLEKLKKFDKIKNDDERTRIKQEVMNSKSVLIDFPSSLRVNTIDHLKKFSRDVFDRKAINIKNLQEEYPIENLPLDMNIPDNIMLLLFAGIGIFDPTSSYLPQIYTDTVLDMASEGELAILIATDSICYGANYPFSNVIITDEVGMNHSIYTIFQLAGRAGRVGTSWSARIHVGNEVGRRIIDYIRNDYKTSSEAININNIFEEKLKLIKDNRNISTIKISEI